MARVTDHTNLWTVIQVMEVTGALKGENVCVTGHLSLPRDQIHTIIKQAGGRIHTDCKYDTTILVSNGDFTASTVQEIGGVKKSSKLLKAERNNQGGYIRTRVLSEDLFAQMIIDRGQASAMPVEP